MANPRTKRRRNLGIPYCTEYQIWRMMWERCLDPTNRRFKDYGGRGIAVCERWRDFFAFVEDMGRRPSTDHSLDRKDNDGDYHKDNCRWATRIEQALNKRSTRQITIDGVTKSLRGWTKHYGIDRDTALRRYAVTKDWQQAFEMDGRLPRSNSFLVTINGVTRTIKQWSELTNIPMKLLWQRICRDELSPEQAITKGRSAVHHPKTKQLTIDGITDSLSGWCKRVGMSRASARRRYYKLGDWRKVFEQLRE